MDNGVSSEWYKHGCSRKEICLCTWVGLYLCVYVCILMYVSCEKDGDAFCTMEYVIQCL